MANKPWLVIDKTSKKILLRDVSGSNKMVIDDPDTANIDLCCCSDETTICCECGAEGGDVCCYNINDTIELTVDVSFDNGRICAEACAADKRLTCDDCSGGNWVGTYELVFCIPGVSTLWVISSIDFCLPYAIKRDCILDSWILLTIAEVPIPPCLAGCNNCIRECDINDPFPCISVTPCEASLTCCCDICDEASPPIPYEICTHDPGDPVTVDGSCVCVGDDCYNYDFICWLSICHFNEESTCTGFDPPTFAQRCKTVEITLNVTNNCEDDGGGNCAGI